jgi:hypothetical protein
MSRMRLAGIGISMRLAKAVFGCILPNGSKRTKWSGVEVEHVENTFTALQTFPMQYIASH